MLDLGITARANVSRQRQERRDNDVRRYDLVAVVAIRLARGGDNFYRRPVHVLPLQRSEVCKISGGHSINPFYK